MGPRARLPWPATEARGDARRTMQAMHPRFFPARKSVAAPRSLLQTRAMRQSKSKEPEQPPSRRNRTEAVARGAAPLTADIFARAGFRDPALVLRWAEIAGPEVARICQPVKLSEGVGGVLTLK